MDTNLESTGPGSAKSISIHQNRPHKITWIEMGLFALLVFTGIGLAFISVHWSFIIAILAVVLAVGSLMIIKRPEIGLLLIIVAIPLEDFNKIGDLGSLSLIKLLTIGVLGAYLIHHFAINRKDSFVNPTQNAYIIALLIAILVSYFAAIDPAAALDQTFRFLRLVAFYFLVVNIVRSQASLERVVWAMIITGILSAGYGLYEYYFVPEALNDMRVSGTLDDPMSFAYSLVILLPLIWYMITRKPKMIFRILLYAVGLVYSYAIILSGTRSGILAEVGVLVWIALRQGRKMVLNTALVLIIAAFSVFFMPEQVKSRLGLSATTDQSAQSSSERRLTYYTFGLDLFLQNPIVGVGLGGFTRAYSHSEYQYFRSADDVDRIAHSMYLELATGAGLLGLVPFLLVLYTPILNLQKTKNALRSGPLAELSKMLQISIGAFAFIGFFSSSQFDKPLWLLIGLATAIPEIVKSESTSTAAPQENLA